MLKKRFASLFLALAMVLGLSGQAFALELQSANELFLDMELAQNTALMDQVFDGKDRTQTRSSNPDILSNLSKDRNSTAAFCISNDKQNVNLVLTIEGEIYNINLTGDFEVVNEGAITGFIGVYEGVVDFVSGENSFPVTVIADIVFTNEEMFAAVTIHFDDPVILFYGDFSKTLAKISNSYNERIMEEQESHYSANSPMPLAEVPDSGILYQGENTIFVGTYPAGYLSIFHVNSVPAQSPATIYVKANSYCESMRTYVSKVLGYGSNLLLLYPDTFKISICGNNDRLHALGIYYPANDVQTGSIGIPYLPTGTPAGLQALCNLLTFDISLSRSIVKEEPYSSTSHPNNKVSWELFSFGGWLEKYDGNWESKAGMGVRAPYMYEGRVTGNYNTTLTATASIRYEYSILVNGDVMTLHLTTKTASQNSTLTIRK